MGVTCNVSVKEKNIIYNLISFSSPNFPFFFVFTISLTYLINAYGKSEHEQLYPKDVDKRAIVDLYLQFDLSTLYQRTYEYFFPTILLGAPLDESKKAKLSEGLHFFEVMLSKDKKFTTSDNFTIADLSLCVTVSQIEAFDFDLLPYPKVRKWLTECIKFLTEVEQYGYEVNITILYFVSAFSRKLLDYKRYL